MSINRIILKEKQFEWKLRPCDLLYPYKLFHGKNIRYYGYYGLGEKGQLTLQHIQFLWLQGANIDFHCVETDRFHKGLTEHDQSYLLLRKLMNNPIANVDIVICQCPIAYYPYIVQIEKQNNPSVRLIGFLLWQSISLPTWIHEQFQQFNEIICISSWHAKQYKSYFQNHTLKVIHSMSPYCMIPTQTNSPQFEKTLEQLRSYKTVLYMIDEYHPQSNIFLGITYYLKSFHRRKDVCLYVNIVIPTPNYQFQEQEQVVYNYRVQYLIQHIKSITEDNRFRPKVIIDCQEHSRHEIQQIHEIGTFFISTKYGTLTALEYNNIPPKNTIITMNEGGHKDYSPFVEGTTAYQMTINAHKEHSQNRRNDVSITANDLFDQFELDNTDSSKTVWLIPNERSMRTIMKSIDVRYKNYGVSMNVDNSVQHNYLRRIHIDEWLNVLEKTNVSQPTLLLPSRERCLILIYNNQTNLLPSILEAITKTLFTRVILVVLGGTLGNFVPPSHRKLEILYLNKAVSSFTYYDLFEYVRWNIPSQWTTVIGLYPMFDFTNSLTEICRIYDEESNKRKQLYFGTYKSQEIEQIDYWITRGGEYIEHLLDTERVNQLEWEIYTLNSSNYRTGSVLSYFIDCGFSLYNVSAFCSIRYDEKQSIQTQIQERNNNLLCEKVCYIYPCQLGDLTTNEDFKLVSEKRMCELFFGRQQVSDTYIQSASYVYHFATSYMVHNNIASTLDQIHYIVYWVITIYGRIPSYYEIQNLMRYERFYLETLYETFDEYRKLSYSESKQRDIHTILMLYTTVRQSTEKQEPLNDIPLYICAKSSATLPKNMMVVGKNQITQIQYNFCDRHVDLMGLINCQLKHNYETGSLVGFLDHRLFGNDDFHKRNVLQLDTRVFGLSKSLDKSKLYGFSFMPLHDIDEGDTKWKDEFIKKLKTSSRLLYPHFNSFIVRYEVFHGLRNYLFYTIPLIIAKYGRKNAAICCIGHYIERLVAYYLGTQYEDRDKVRFGEVLGTPYMNSNQICSYYDYYETIQYPLGSWYDIFTKHGLWLEGYERIEIMTERDMRDYQDIYPERLQNRAIIITGSSYLYDYMRDLGFPVVRVDSTDKRFSKKELGRNVLSPDS